MFLFKVSPARSIAELCVRRYTLPCTHTNSLPVLVIPVKTGENFIERNSREFTSTVGDYDSFKSMLKAAESGSAYTAGADRHCGFPDRLVLPIGQKAGVPYTLFVMVTPYGSEERPEDFHGHNAYNTNTNVYSCNGLWTALDNRPLGFPFDRKIENFGRFYTPNMYFKDVFIFHKDTSDVRSHFNVIFKKNVNDFDNSFKTVHKYNPGHVDEVEDVVAPFY